MKNCIFCDKPNDATSIEHIIPESFGNKTYLIERSAVCDKCNADFSSFERKALSNSVFTLERARYGIVTKKGKYVTGNIGKLSFEGDKNFIKNQLSIKGVNSENFKNFNSETGFGELHVETFDKSEESACKLALKIGLESIYTSREKIFEKYNFSELKSYLTKLNNKPWPFLMSDFEENFISVPQFKMKYDLKTFNHCELKFIEIDESTLLFKFKFGSISIVVNLLSRQFDWSKKFVDKDKLSQIYPKHFRNKV